MLNPLDVSAPSFSSDVHEATAVPTPGCSTPSPERSGGECAIAFHSLPLACIFHVVLVACFVTGLTGTSPPVSFLSLPFLEFFTSIPVLQKVKKVWWLGADCDADNDVIASHHYLNHTEEQGVADILHAGTVSPHLPKLS